MKFGNHKRMAILKTISNNEGKKKSSKKSTRGVPRVVEESITSSTRSTSDTSFTQPSSSGSIGKRPQEQEGPWKTGAVDYKRINRVHNTWGLIKDSLGDRVFGERLVRKMVEIEPSSQWLMRLETLAGARFDSLCTNISKTLETFVFMMEPDSDLQDLFPLAQELREEGVSPDLLADALPICAKTALRDYLTLADDDAWRETVVPALRALEMDTLFWDTPLY